MNQKLEIPKEFLPLPELPPGYSRWEYRGHAWINLNYTVYAWRTRLGEWYHDESMNAYGVNGQYFIEAVK